MLCQAQGKLRLAGIWLVPRTFYSHVVVQLASLQDFKRSWNSQVGRSVAIYPAGGKYWVARKVVQIESKRGQDMDFLTFFVWHTHTSKCKSTHRFPKTRILKKQKHFKSESWQYYCSLDSPLTSSNQKGFGKLSSLRFLGPLNSQYAK